MTSPSTLEGCAPSAMRMPISRVRRATEYAITPYSPIAASVIAITPTMPTSHAPARTGNSVVATSASIV